MNGIKQYLSAPIVYWKAFLKLIRESDLILKEEVSFQIFLGRWLGMGWGYWSHCPRNYIS